MGEAKVPSRTADLLETILGVAALVGGLTALWLAFVHAPVEASMGLIQRTLYLHVPAAATAFLGFATVFVASCMFLRTGRVWWDHLAAAAAELGVLFSTVVLVSGPLWAKPIWGTYWRWEPRLTAMLILCATYAAYLMLRHYGGRTDGCQRAAAVFGIFAFANIPAVYFSARLWAASQQLHPQHVQLEPRMRLALGVSTVASALLFVCLLDIGVRLQQLADRVAGLEESADTAEALEGAATDAI